MRIRFIALLVAGLLSAEAGAQSLPDVARSERERRREVTPGRVFTNETLATLGSISIIGARAVAGATPAQADADDEEDTEVRGEAQWRQLFSEARAEVVRAGERLQLNQQEVVDLNQRLLTESGLFNREGLLLPEIQAKEEEIVEGQARVAAADQAISDLQQDLRRAGAPAGWGRP